jgi:hypothetical protein
MSIFCTCSGRNEIVTSGIIGQTAPELRVPIWIDGSGEELSSLKLGDLGDGHKILYCFQHWCPGCHSHGFPSLKKLVDNSADKPVGFAVVQTVFEGADHNTRERIFEAQARYDLKIAFGHDPAHRRYPTVMEDYRTGGTPWFIVIEPSGQVAFNSFELDADAFLSALPGES